MAYQRSEQAWTGFDLRDIRWEEAPSTDLARCAHAVSGAT